MDRLVLKGGSALDFYAAGVNRASVDIDMSMDAGFTLEELAGIGGRMEKLLKESFAVHSLLPFDVTFSSKPPQPHGEIAEFWGGYQLEFKVTHVGNESLLEQDIDAARRDSIILGPMNRRKFKVDISRHEYCGEKEQHLVDGYVVYVYPPVMIIIEKLRAICQQTPDYRAVVQSHEPTPRARDFFDIWLLCKKCEIDLDVDQHGELVKTCFEAKRVPLSLLGTIRQRYSFHLPDFDSVKDTVTNREEVQEFAVYFEFVTALSERFESLWNV